jgi:hypothetical protein
MISTSVAFSNPVSLNETGNGRYLRPSAGISRAPCDLVGYVLSAGCRIIGYEVLAVLTELPADDALIEKSEYVAGSAVTVATRTFVMKGRVKISK